MQRHRGISCLLGCGQNNVVALSVHYTGSLGQGSGFGAKLLTGQYSQLTLFECVVKEPSCADETLLETD